VAARLGDPEEARRELRHLEPGVLNRQHRACRFVRISGAFGHCATLRGTREERLKPYQALAGFRKELGADGGDRARTALQRGKDPRNYVILIGLGSCPIRALKGQSTLVFNGLTG
jgi:hypothetical protein